MLIIAALKKLTAILLLLLFVFNIIGYKLLMQFVIDVASSRLESKLDDGRFNDADLVALKIPLNLPYNNNWSEFERVNGEITIGNIIYKYVKQKVFNDTLILLCIPHDSKTIIEQTTADYSGKVNGIPMNEGGKKADVLKKQMSDYDYDEACTTARVTEKSETLSPRNNACKNEKYNSPQEQPPDFKC